MPTCSINCLPNAIHVQGKGLFYFELKKTTTLRDYSKVVHCINKMRACFTHIHRLTQIMHFMHCMALFRMTKILLTSFRSISCVQFPDRFRHTLVC